MKKELSIKVNGYLANVAVLYIKLHNLHWNVTGIQFKEVHEYLENLYDEFAVVLDAVAELLKMHGEMPLSSLRDYLDVATIEELENKPVKVNETLNIVLEDIQAMKALAEEIRIQAAEEDNFPVVNMMEDHLEHYSKEIWFLSSMLN